MPVRKILLKNDGVNFKRQLIPVQNNFNGYTINVFNGTVANSMLNPSINNFLNRRNATENTNHPRSWLNIIVLDEQLKPVITNDGNNSYFDQVGNPGTPNVKQYNPQRPITKNGYVYIYVSNELRSNQRDNKK